MGSRLNRSTDCSAKFGTSALGAWFSLTLFVPPAWAQHADAGVEHRAARPAAPAERKPPSEASGILPKRIDPNMLSEGVLAGLQERTAGRQAASLPSSRPELGKEPGRLPDPTLSATPRHAPGGEPLRRGEAHMRRVQAVETGKGVTLLSNRIHPSPEPQLAALAAQVPRERSEPPSPAEALATEPPRVTETHSLRPSSSQSSKHAGTGLGWLLWPFVLFVTTGAVVGTLWFRNKTQ
jgi:hypothetical protein